MIDYYCAIQVTAIRRFRFIVLTYRQTQPPPTHTSPWQTRHKIG